MSSTHIVPHDRRVGVAERPRPRRVVEGVGLVAAWIGLGYLFPVSAEDTIDQRVRHGKPPIPDRDRGHPGSSPRDAAGPR